MTITFTKKVYPWVRDQDMLKNGAVRDDLLIVDVRTPAEYAESHIPESFNVPLADLYNLKEEIKRRGEGKHVVLMCRTQNRAKLAYEQMVQAGLQDCHVLEGGITKWAEAKLPLVCGEKAISMERQVRMVAGALIVGGVLLGFEVHPFLHVLPAIVGAGLFYSGLTDSCKMAMLLARLPMHRAKPSVLES